MSDKFNGSTFTAKRLTTNGRTCASLSMHLRLMESVRVGYFKAKVDSVGWNCQRWKHPNCGLFVYCRIPLVSVKVAMSIQPLGGTKRCNHHVGVIRRRASGGIYEVIVRYSKGVFEFMGNNGHIATSPGMFVVEDVGGYDCYSAFWSPRCGQSTRLGFVAYIQCNEVDISPRVKTFGHFVPDFIVKVRMVMRIVKLPLHMMHHSFSIAVGFQPEGSSAEPVIFHLLCVRLLYIFHQLIQLCVYVWLGLAILGQEVDHSHRARVPHVQIRQPLAGRAEPIELPRLEIDRLA